MSADERVGCRAGAAVVQVGRLRSSQEKQSLVDQLACCELLHEHLGVTLSRRSIAGLEQLRGALVESQPRAILGHGRATGSDARYQQKRRGGRGRPAPAHSCSSGGVAKMRCPA